MKPWLETDRVTLYHAKAEEVYPHLSPGFTLAILDGPYGLSIADWDRMKVDDLSEWYRPHLEAVTALMAPSASMYVWNRDSGSVRLDPLIRSLGWEARGFILWDKCCPPSQLGWKSARMWLDQTEVCRLYQRGRPHFEMEENLGNVWSVSIPALTQELLKQTEKKQDRNPERGMTLQALHPTQKPLLFADRIIRASSRPGDRILVPFGGTSREALACHRLPPEEARHCTSIEMDLRYLEAVRGCFTLDTTPRNRGQVGLFGGAP